MKMQLNKGILRFLIASLLLIGWVQVSLAQDSTRTSTGFVADKIIAKVDNYIVLKSELEGAYQNYLAEGNPASGNARCGMLNRLIVNKLLVAKAEIDSVTVSDEEVDMETDQRMQICRLIGMASNRSRREVTFPVEIVRAAPRPSTPYVSNLEPTRAS